MADAVAPIADAAFLAGGGEMGALMRAHDWASTSLGSPETWPQPLRTALRLLLNTGHPMYVWWGPELLCFYNDAYRASIGPERHPGSLGRPGREVWDEIWPIIGPQIEQVMSGGGATWQENALVPITRNGRREDVYWTYSYGPLDDEAAPTGVGGVLVVCTETTEQVLSEQRARQERERLARLFEQAPGFITFMRGPEHVFEFTNASFQRLFGNREFVGKPAREGFPELEGQGFHELLDQVYTSGERFVARNVPIRLEPTPGAPPKELVLNFIYEPVTDEAGQVTGIFFEGHDVTKAQRAEAALRESEERQAFLLRLSDALRPLEAPGDIQQTASRLLAEHLGVSRAMYAEVHGQGDSAETVIRGQHVRGVEPFPERTPYKAFTEGIADEPLRDGETVVVADTASDPRFKEEVRQNWLAAGMAAIVALSVLKKGRVAYIFGVHSPHPRAWSADDVALVEEVAERTWAAAERARTETELRESEARFRLMADAVPQIVWITDAAGRVEFFNKQWSDYTGVAYEPTTAAEVAARYVHLDDEAATAAAFTASLRTGTTFEVEHRIRSAAGDYRWFLVRGEPYRDPQSGEIVHWFGASVDIHDRRQAEAELRESEERFRAIVETATDYAIFTTDSEGRIAIWPKGAQEIFGWTAEEAVGQPGDMTFTPEDRAAGQPEKERQEARDTGQAANVRWHMREDGSRVFIEGISRPLHGPDGLLLGFVKVGQDVTKRRATEERLRESEARFRQFGDASGDVLWIRDCESLAFEYVSPAMEEVYGIRPESLLEGNHMLRWAGMIVPEDRDKALDAVRRVRAGEHVLNTFRILRTDGQVRWIRDLTFPLLDADGQVQRIGGIAHDATEEIELQDRLKVLVAELQHRTRNLMGVVRSVTDKSLSSSTSLPDFQGRIRDRLNALARVNSLLSRLDGGRRITFGELILTELMAHGVVDTQDPNSQVRLDGPEGIRLRSSTVQTLALGLHELATNALKYGALSRPEGRLTVSWDLMEDPDGEPRLRVDWRETGVPMLTVVPDGSSGGEVTAPRRRGYGRELIERALPYQLKAKTTYEITPEGVRCTITLPVSSTMNARGGTAREEADA